MLANIAAPTDLKSVDKDPSYSPIEKLEIIEASPIYIEQFLNGFDLSLPFVDGVSYTIVGEKTGQPRMHVEHANIGDKALYGQGIGTRLLKAALRHGFEAYPDLTQLTSPAVRLGFLNTIVKVAGKDNVSVELNDETYGLGSDKSLEAMFGDVRPVPGQSYIVDEVKAVIEPHIAIAGELPTTDC